MAVVKQWVEVDSEGNIVHTCKAEFVEPPVLAVVVEEGVATQEEADLAFQNEVSQKLADLQTEVESKGRQIGEVPEEELLPQPGLHKLDVATGFFKKRTRAEIFGPAPKTGPDDRPSLDTIPEPPKAKLQKLTAAPVAERQKLDKQKKSLDERIEEAVNAPVGQSPEGE